MAGRFSIEAVFKAIDKVTAPVSRMQNRVSKFTRSMNRNFHKLNRVVKKFGSGLKRAAVVGTTSLVAMGFAIGNLIRTGADFGRAIGAAAAKFPDKIKRGTKEFKALEEAARRVGATTEFTATQAAQGLNFLAKAGFNAEFSMQALGDIVNFATASEMDLAEAADIASDAIGAFGLDSKDLGQKMKGLNRVMDVMSLTANSTNTSVAEMFEAVKKGAPIAIKAGQSLETFSAIAGTLASVGIKGSAAGIATKNIALALAGVGNQASKTFRRLKIPLTINGRMRDVADVFDDLSKSVSKMDDDKLLAVMNAIFGKISLASAANLLGEGSKKVRELREQFEKGGGSAKRTAEFIRDDVKGSIDGLVSAVESVKISIFSLNEGPLKSTIDRMTEWVRANEKLIASKIGGFLLLVLNNLDKIAVAIGQIGLGIASFIALNLALQAVGATLTIINLLMAANPIVLGIMAAVAAVALLSGALDPIIEMISTITGGISSAFNTVSGLIGSDVVSPQDRVARSIEEQRNTNNAEVTIKTEEGATAEVTGGSLGQGLNLQPSGGF